MSQISGLEKLASASVIAPLEEVEVTCDTYPGKVFKGKITYVASISEFTPRNVQTLDERRHQVFGFKVRVDDSQGVFKAGMAADVRIPVR